MCWHLYFQDGVLVLQFSLLTYEILDNQVKEQPDYSVANCTLTKVYLLNRVHQFVKQQFTVAV